MKSSKTGHEAAATGSSVLILLAILLISFLLFVTKEGPQRQVTALDKKQTPSVSQEMPIAQEEQSDATATNSNLTQTVHGQQVRFTLRLPPDWATQSLVMDGVDNLSASFRNANVAVMVQQSNVNTSQEAATAAVKSLQAAATNFASTKPERMILDGKPWLKFIAKCQINQAPMGYQYYVYSGAEGTYQIVAWTDLQNFESQLHLLQSIMQTFRFPRPGEPQADNTPPEATILTRAAVP
jgi:hypothetical protein